MARSKGKHVDPRYGRLIKLYCQEGYSRQHDLAIELGISYPTLNRGINGNRVDPSSKRTIEGLAKRIAIEHPDLLEMADAEIDFNEPMHIIAQRLADRFDLGKDQAVRIARSVTRGLRIFV